MTEYSERQAYIWGNPSAEHFKWLNDRHFDGLQPAIIFHDPSSGELLTLLTGNNERHTFTIRRKHGLLKEVSVSHQKSVT